MGDFNTQQDIWAYLASGGEVTHKAKRKRIKFKNGKLVDGETEKPISQMMLTDYRAWSKYYEPVKYDVVIYTENPPSCELGGSLSSLILGGILTYSFHPTSTCVHKIKVTVEEIAE